MTSEMQETIEIKMCRNVEICADSTLWMQTHKVSCILWPDFSNCCRHFLLWWHLSAPSLDTLSGWNWKESCSVIIRRHDYKCAFDASHCSPLVQVQEELDGLMDFLVEWGSATITARASPLWNTILSLYWIKMMMSAQYRSTISTYTLGAPCLFISQLSDTNDSP